MTNNPTIDGVSRSTIEAIIGDMGTKAYVDAWKELRALLDAPAVERQEPYGFASVLIDNFQFSIDNGKPLTFSKGDLLWLIEQLSKAQSESAALQSTIAQLRQHKNDYMEAAEETRKALSDDIAQLQARVQELESGRGEPVAAVCVYHIDQWYASHPSKAGRNVGVTFTGDTSRLIDGQLLFTTPPAPVAVVLPERKEIIPGRETNREDSGWNACLDAVTAALNKEK